MDSGGGVVLRRAEPPLHAARPVSHRAEPPLHAAEPVLHRAEPPLHAAGPVRIRAELPLHAAEPVSCRAELPLHASRPFLHLHPCEALLGTRSSGSLPGEPFPPFKKPSLCGGLV